jgi:hypothetical protein
MKGEKCRRCSRHQASRSFFFFSLWWASDTLWGSLNRWDFVSTSMIRMLIMQSVRQAQRHRTKMLPRSSLWLFWIRRLTAGLSCFSGVNTLTPQKAAKMWEQSKILALLFGCVKVVGSGIADPAHLTGRSARARWGSPSSYLSPKRVGRKVLARVCLMDTNLGPIRFVTLCTNCYSCCKDFCKPA